MRGATVSRRDRVSDRVSDRVRAAAAGALLAATLAVLGACDRTSGPPPMRLWTDDLAFQVSTDPVPPYAREEVRFKVVVRDKSSGQPIEGGEGRIYATSADGTNVWDGLAGGPQAGAYYGRLHFITAGNWAMGMQFRRDSTRPLEKLDWRQQVWPARGEAPIR